MLPVSTTPFYVSPDQLGAPHQVTNSVHLAVWTWPHDPFGNGNPTGSITYGLRLPGQMANSETGLFNNGFRDYDPTTGRYAQSDPIGLRGGVNAFAYVTNYPANLVDLRGTCIEDACIGEAFLTIEAIEAGEASLSLVMLFGSG
jgi:RHS repeat-associated protein